MVELKPAHSGPLLAEARALIQEYADALGAMGYSLDFQSFREELAGLPGDYAPPRGRLLVAVCDGRVAGCVGLRPLGEGVCEMKRLFVRPGFRGQRVGRHLAEGIVAEGRALSYRLMRLDTVAALKEAVALYEGMGFKAIAPYCENPFKDARFFELRLDT